MNTLTNLSDAAAVRALVELASEAQNDPGTLLPLHTEDTAIVNIAGRRVLGRDVLTEAMTSALASSLADVRTSVEVLDVRFPAPDLALVSCTKTVHDERPDAERTSLPALGALTYVLVRTENGWRIALAQTTPVVG